MSFPKFPEFRKISITDKTAYLHYYSQLDEPYSDFSFDNLLIWLNYYNDLEACDLNGNLIIRFTNVLDEASLSYSFIGCLHLEVTLNTIFNFLAKQTSKIRLLYVPEQTIRAIEQFDLPRLRIEEDVNNKDYVYNVEDLAKMKGKRYRNLRERVIKFESGKNIQTKLFDLTNKHDRRLVEETILRWSTREKFLRNDPEKFELDAIKTHLELAKHFTVRVYGIFVNDKLACITIVHSPPHEGWLIGNHLKYDYDYPGAFGYAVHNLALIAQSEGIKWLNCEQDLGKEGLRFIKTILRPEKFLRRYTITLTDESKI